MSNVTMREMLEAGVHFGHQARFWNPKIAPYLFGKRKSIHIFNLEETLPLYNEAINFIGKLAASKGTIMFVGTKRAAQSIIQDEASRCEMPYVNRRWLGGLLTNFKTVKQSINRLKKLEKMAEDGHLERMSKKELLQHTREKEKLERSVSGIKNMPGMPDALFIIDVGYENIAVSEARKLGIPVIGVVDSNNSPDCIDYVIPGNDDAIRSIRLYVKGAADAILEGRQSTAHLGEDIKADDFVELDESGTPIAPAEVKQEPNATAKVKIKKKTPKKKTSKSDDEGQAKKVAVEELDAKKVDANKVDDGESTASQADETVAESTDIKPEKEAASKKKVTKKKVTKKKTTKKKTTKKTAAAVEEPAAIEKVEE